MVPSPMCFPVDRAQLTYGITGLNWAGVWMHH